MNTTNLDIPTHFLNLYLFFFSIFYFSNIPYINKNMPMVMFLYPFLSNKNLPSNLSSDHKLYTFFHKKEDVQVLIDRQSPSHIIPHVGPVSIFISVPTITIVIYKTTTIFKSIRYKSKWSHVLFYLVSLIFI